MEAIKNYLDMMFANLPNTESVKRAKEELLQMMEDKYTELIAEGKSENEAVGSVISEFGNLSELAEALGVKEEVKKQEEKKEQKAEKGETERVLTAEEAKGYINMKSRRALPFALGVALFILAPTLPITFSFFLNDPSFDAFGPLGFFGCIAAGILLIIFGASDRKNWKYVKREKCTLSMDATKHVVEDKNRVEAIYRVWFVLGIILCATCWFPAAMLGDRYAYSDLVSPVALLAMVGTGVFLILYSNTCTQGYKDLLRLNARDSVKGAYVPEEKHQEKKVKYASPFADFIMGVYWPTITCAYLISSFVSFRFGITWLIWPIAGILHPLLVKALPKEKTDEN